MFIKVFRKIRKSLGVIFGVWKEALVKNILARVPRIQVTDELVLAKNVLDYYLKVPRVQTISIGLNGKIIKFYGFIISINSLLSVPLNVMVESFLVSY